jgi:hypothetical protein
MWRLRWKEDYDDEKRNNEGVDVENERKQK